MPKIENPEVTEILTEIRYDRPHLDDRVSDYELGLGVYNAWLRFRMNVPREEWTPTQVFFHDQYFPLLVKEFEDEDQWDSILKIGK